MASPLWITYDIFNPPVGIHEIVTNPEAIAIDQDRLGRMAVRIDGSSQSPRGLSRRLPAACGLESIWPNGEQLARPLAGGDTAVLLFNRLLSNLTITLRFEDIGDTREQCFHVRDIWARRNLGVHVGSFTALSVPPHGNRFLRLTPASNHSFCASPTPPACNASMAPPTGFNAMSQPGFWANSRFSSRGAATSVSRCALVCEAAGASCLGFHVFMPCNAGGGCYVYEQGSLGAFIPHANAHAFRRNAGGGQP